jgi:hypothetical protein
MHRPTYRAKVSICHLHPLLLQCLGVCIMYGKSLQNVDFTLFVGVWYLLWVCSVCGQVIRFVSGFA